MNPPTGAEERRSALAEVVQAYEADTAEAPPVTEPPRRGMLHALRHRNYRYFWTGNFLSNIGNWMQSLAQGWLVLQLTDSVFLLGLVGFTSAFPSLGFTLIGGVIADRHDRRRMMLATQATMMAAALAMALLTWLRVINVWEILALTFVSGLAAALNAPAYQAVVPELVPAEDLTNAIAMNSAQFNLSRVIGPALGGAMLLWFGAAGCFLVNGLSFLALLYAITQLHLRPPAATHEGLWGPLADGFRYIRRRPDLAILLGNVAVVSLCAIPYVSLAPYFAREILHRGPEGLGYLMAASGIGALGGAFLLARFGDRPRKGERALRGSLVIYGALIVFALSRDLRLSVAALMVAGGALVTAISTVNNVLQKHVSDEMRGRVMSMHATAFLGFAPLGSLVAGSLAHSFGAPAALVTLCAIAFLATLWPLRLANVRELG